MTMNLKRIAKIINEYLAIIKQCSYQISVLKRLIESLTRIKNKNNRSEFISYLMTTLLNLINKLRYKQIQ